VEYGRNAKPAAPVAFAAPVAAVCAGYPHAPAVAEPGGPGIRTAEQTGSQALERAAPPFPMPPGLVERPEDAYRRHGTQGLSANCDGAPGAVVAPPIGPSRPAEACAGPMAPTIATAPEASWLFSVDQLNMHKSAAWVRLVANAWGSEAALGEKEKRGRLQSMQTRAAFLSEVNQRLRFM